MITFVCHNYETSRHSYQYTTDDTYSGILTVVCSLTLFVTYREI
jgi:hypothetical protein